jgi:hypothetical protein
MTASLLPTNRPPPIGVRGDTIIESFALPLGDGLVLCHPGQDRLAVLNATGKVVWDLLRAGLARDEIASVFALHFGLSFDGACADVATAIAGIEGAPLAEFDPPRGRDAPPIPGSRDPHADDPTADCGEFRFGDRVVRLFSAVPGVGCDYFSRFQHRAANPPTKTADILELAACPSGYRLTFRRKIVAEVHSLPELIAGANELFLRWEHPEVEFLAYFHAAAIGRDECAILLPGVSGAGKSTLVAYLTSHGFFYLGDDLIAMAASDWSLRPLPTALSLKSGAWPILEDFYPQLRHRPTVQCHGRAARYVQPKETRNSAGTPSLILFPKYVKNGEAHVGTLKPLQTMTRLLESGTDLEKCASGANLVEFIRFIESTPAYEFRYSDLRSAKDAIEELL